MWLAALSAAAAGTEDVDSFKRALVITAASYEGATGPTTLDAAGDRADAAYDVWAIVEENGQYVWKPVAPWGGVCATAVHRERPHRARHRRRRVHKRWAF